MSCFDVSLTRSSTAAVDRMSHQEQKKVARFIDSLAEDPFIGGVTTMNPAAHHQERYGEVGQYRVVYVVDEGRNKVLVLSVFPHSCGDE